MPHLLARAASIQANLAPRRGTASGSWRNVDTFFAAASCLVFQCLVPPTVLWRMLLSFAGPHRFLAGLESLSYADILIII
jgi:hypothetical protein